MFSDDGRRAFDSYRADIFVMNAGGSGKTRITDETRMPGASTADNSNPLSRPASARVFGPPPQRRGP